jgi:hypothetical protein
MQLSIITQVFVDLAVFRVVADVEATFYVVVPDDLLSNDTNSPEATTRISPRVLFAILRELFGFAAIAAFGQAALWLQTRESQSLTR